MMQAAVAGGVSIVFFAVWGAQYGLSALAGGAIAVLPNFVFATLAFSHTGASSAGKVMKTFYWGEAVKLLLTIAMFSLAFINLKVVFMPLFVCYVAALIAFVPVIIVLSLLAMRMPSFPVISFGLLGICFIAHVRIRY